MFGLAPEYRCLTRLCRPDWLKRQAPVHKGPATPAVSDRTSASSFPEAFAPDRSGAKFLNAGRYIGGQREIMKPLGLQSRRRLDPDARPHGRGNRDLLEIGALSARRL